MLHENIRHIFIFLDLDVWKNTMKVYDANLARIVPGDMNVKNNGSFRDIGKIIRSIYTNDGLFQDNLGAGIQVINVNKFISLYISKR